MDMIYRSPKDELIQVSIQC